jgi:hypothetical protein
MQFICYSLNKTTKILLKKLYEKNSITHKLIIKFRIVVKIFVEK